MKLADTFDSIGLVADTRARRRSNVSRKTANVTADQIESGLTLEALEDCGVPVFRYQTQVTLHGKITDFNPSAKQGGYKAVFRNGNGTLGVRYSAIDAAKKAELGEALKLSKSPWHPHFSSTGMEIHLYSTDKQVVIDAFKAFPRSLVCGSVVCGAGVFGGYYCVANIGAVPAENMAALITALCGNADIAKLRAEKEVADAAQRAEWDAEAAKAQVARDQRVADNLAKAKALAATLGTPLSSVPTSGSFRRVLVSPTTGEAIVATVTLSKSFGRLRYAADSTGKTNELTTTTLARWNAQAAQGLIFPAA